MANASDLAGNIHEGFWIDRTRSGVMGYTLTLCPTSAILLTNSLAIWVTICGIQIWAVIRYVLHQRDAVIQREPPTPHLNSQQAILRNAGSALTTAQLMFELARKSRGRRSIRAYAIALSAVMYASLFTIAGISSNKAISAPSVNGGSAVLLRNNNCGVWNTTILDIVRYAKYSTLTEWGMFTQYAAREAYDVQVSLGYSNECYTSKAAKDSPSSTCQTLRSPNIRRNVSSSASCPFARQICLENPETITMDTGDIDSHLVLGINAAPEDRLKYRKITTCSVFNSTSYAGGWDGEVVSASSPRPTPEMAWVNYGPSISQKTDWTYAYSNFASFYNNFSAKVTGPYFLGVQYAFAPSESPNVLNSFSPIPELAKDTADVTLMFLSFTGKYLGPVDDPWFSASNEQHFEASKDFLQDRYAPDAAISTVGCSEQHIFCTNQGYCTDPLGFNQVQNVDSFNRNLTPKQNATFNRILEGVYSSRLAYIVPYLAMTTSPLLANTFAFDGKSGDVISEPLPKDQWKREIANWHSIGMAHLQRIIARWATGQIVPDPQYLDQPTEPQDVWFCRSFVVPSTTYESFSVLAIVLIVFFGTLIIIVGSCIDPLAELFKRRFKGTRTPRRPWARDAIFELQRRGTVARSTPRIPTDLEASTAAFQRSSPSQPENSRVGLENSARSTRNSWMTISLRDLPLTPPPIPQNFMSRGTRSGPQGSINPSQHPRGFQRVVGFSEHTPVHHHAPGWI